MRSRCTSSNRKCNCRPSIIRMGSLEGSSPWATLSIRTLSKKALSRRRPKWRTNWTHPRSNRMACWLPCTRQAPFMWPVWVTLPTARPSRWAWCQLTSNRRWSTTAQTTRSIATGPRNKWWPLYGSQQTSKVPRSTKARQAPITCRRTRKRWRPSLPPTEEKRHHALV